MDFQAVIKAILNKGDVESQLADLVKDRDVHINPTVGTSGSTNTTLNNQIKRQANAQAKSYVQYSKSAIQKQMKHASGTFYSSGETNIDKGLISRQKKQAEEMASVITDIAKNEGISDKDAKKYAKNVSKIYETGSKKTYALSDVSFEIDKGEFVVILGQSGAGKSTLLNILGGIDSLSTGEVIVNDSPLSKMKELNIEQKKLDLSFSSIILFLL